MMSSASHRLMAVVACSAALALANPTHAVLITTDDLESEVHISGLRHSALGDATLSGEDLDGDGIPDQLHVSNIGSSGEDGVEIALNANTAGGNAPLTYGISGWSGAIDFAPAGQFPVGGHVMLTAFKHGNIPQPVVVGSVWSARNGNAGITFYPECTDCDSISVKAYRNGDLVADLNRDGKLDVVATGAIGTTKGGAPTFSYYHENPHVTILKFADPTTVTLTGVSGQGSGVPMLVDELHVVAATNGGSQFPSSITITASNLTVGGTLTIAESAALVHTPGISVGGLVLGEALYDGRCVGDAHAVGIQLCDKTSGECVSAIEVSNLGAQGGAGMSGMAFRSRSGHKVIFDDERDARTGGNFALQPVALTPDDVLTLTSAWTPDDSDEVLHSSMTLQGQPGSRVAITADLSDMNAQLMIVEVYHSGVRVGQYSLPLSGFVVTQCCVNPCAAPAISSLIDASHADGLHVPAMIVGFAEPVCFLLDGMFVEGDELRVAAGNADGDKIPIVKGSALGGLHRTNITGGGPGLRSFYITDVSATRVGFTQGYVFGFEHTAIDGATLAVFPGPMAPPMPNIPMPLISLQSPTCEGSVLIDIGNAAEGFGFTQLGSAHTVFKLFSVTGQPQPVGKATGAAFGPCLPPPDQHPLCDGVSPALNDPGYFALDLAELGATSITIEVFSNGVSEASYEILENGAGKFFYSGQSAPIRVTGDVIVDGGSISARKILDYGEAGENVGVQLPDGAIVFGDQVHIIAHGFTSALSAGPGRGFYCLPEDGDEVLVTLADESLQLFGLEHRAQGAARLTAHKDGNDPVAHTQLVLTNPTSGSPAKLITRKSGSIILDDRANLDIVVPDPCAGLPPNCDPYPNGASQKNVVKFKAGAELSATVNKADSSFTGKGPGDWRIDVDATQLGTNTYTVEVLLGTDVVATIHDYDRACVPWREGSDAAWADGVNYLCESSTGGWIVHATLHWEQPLNFTFDTSPVGSTTFEGDALRYIVQSNLNLEGIVETSLTTISIPELVISGMEFLEPPPPPACPADIAPPGGDRVVNVSDLLAVIGAWGPCFAGTPCTADIAPPGPPQGDGHVNVSDLLAVIGSWGACP